MLVARGWTISSGPGAVRGAGEVLALFGATVVIEVGASVWICLTWDPASSLYGFTAPAGMLVVLWRIVLLVWFAYNLVTTSGREPDKPRRHLYRIFGVVFSVWFLALPVVVMIVTPPLSPVWRYKVTRCVLDLTHFTALVAFGLIFWPAWSDRYFDVRGPKGEFAALLGGGRGGAEGDERYEDAYVSSPTIGGGAREDWGL